MWVYISTYYQSIVLFIVIIYFYAIANITKGTVKQNNWQKLQFLINQSWESSNNTNNIWSLLKFPFLFLNLHACRDIYAIGFVPRKFNSPKISIIPLKLMGINCSQKKYLSLQIWITLDCLLLTTTTA